MARTNFLLLLLAVSIAVLSPACSGMTTLSSPNQLSGGQALSLNSFNFIMQPDCNLVLYDGNRALWSSGTNGKGKGRDCRVIMQDDGNLVVYNNANMPLWASNTAGASGSYNCILQSDRNVVVYGRGRALWATGTNFAGTKGVALTQTFDPAKQLKIAPFAIKNVTAGHV